VRDETRPWANQARVGEDANQRLNLAELGKVQGRNMAKTSNRTSGKLAVRECVQEKLVRSVGSDQQSHQGKSQDLVAWIAERGETESLKPIDKAIFKDGEQVIGP